MGSGRGPGLAVVVGTPSRTRAQEEMAGPTRPPGGPRNGLEGGCRVVLLFSDPTSGKCSRPENSEGVMELEARTTPSATEVRLTGRLEFTDHDRLEDIIALFAGARRLVLDLSGLEFIDSAGLGMLLILQEEAAQRNVALVVARPRDEVRRSLELARFGDLLAIEH